MKNFLKTTAAVALMTSALAFSTPAMSADKVESLKEADVKKIIKEYLMENPGLVVDALNEFQRQEQVKQEEESRKALAEHMDFITNYEGSPFIGPKDAKVVLVEFFDYNCGFCKRSLPDIVKLSDEFEDLKIVFKELPILSPDSEVAARYALAANEQGKYFEMHQALMEASGRLNEARILDIAAGLELDVEKLKADKDSAKVTKTIELTREKSTAIGVRGTPAFVVDGELVRGAVGYEPLKGRISKALDASKEDKSEE